MSNGVTDCFKLYITGAVRLKKRKFSLKMLQIYDFTTKKRKSIAKTKDIYVLSIYLLQSFRLCHPSGPTKKSITVALEIKCGLLSQILKDTDISREAFVEL